MKRPDKYERIANPFSYNIAEIARALIQQGEQFTICVRVRDEIFEQRRKPEIVRMLANYGTITRNQSWSRYITLNPHNLDSVQRLEDDFYDDKLPGVNALELNPSRNAVYCRKTLDNYLI